MHHCLHPADCAGNGVKERGPCNSRDKGICFNKDKAVDEVKELVYSQRVKESTTCILTKGLLQRPRAELSCRWQPVKLKKTHKNKVLSIPIQCSPADLSCERKDSTKKNVYLFLAANLRVQS